MLGGTASKTNGIAIVLSLHAFLAFDRQALGAVLGFDGVHAGGADQHMVDVAALHREVVKQLPAFGEQRRE
ncbi:hypothetical protein D3C78_1884110 [compost metagenome]